MKAIIFVVLLLSSLLLPISSFANGGDQRVAEGKYLINLSRSPFTPKTGDNVAMIASFFDIKKDQLITEDLIVKVRIAKLGEGRERKFLFEQDDIRAKGGILEFSYTFQDAGLHEVFFDFAFVSNPQKIYNAPDFLLDIQKPEIAKNTNQPVLIWIGLGAILGLGVGWLILRKKV
ncbi:MAG: LPXTG cell wall anchor domain-containing protein [Patescibacteria group bacterium]